MNSRALEMNPSLSQSSQSRSSELSGEEVPSHASLTSMSQFDRAEPQLAEELVSSSEDGGAAASSFASQHSSFFDGRPLPFEAHSTSAWDHEYYEEDARYLRALHGERSEGRESYLISQPDLRLEPHNNNNNNNNNRSYYNTNNDTLVDNNNMNMNNNNKHWMSVPHLAGPAELSAGRLCGPHSTAHPVNDRGLSLSQHHHNFNNNHFPHHNINNNNNNNNSQYNNNKNDLRKSQEVFVGDLSFFCEEKDLFEFFSQCGRVEHCRVVRNNDRTRSLMFGFVTMGSEAEAIAAAKTLNNQSFMGRTIKVEVSERRLGEPIKHTPAYLNGFQIHLSFTSTFSPNKVVKPTELFLRQFFSQFGAVVDVLVREYTVHQYQNKQEGYGFITFEGEEGAVQAAHACSSAIVDGIVLTATLSYRNKPTGKQYALPSSRPPRALPSSYGAQGMGGFPQDFERFSADNRNREFPVEAAHGSYSRHPSHPQPAHVHPSSNFSPRSHSEFIPEHSDIAVSPSLAKFHQVPTSYSQRDAQRTASAFYNEGPQRAMENNVWRDERRGFECNGDEDAAYYPSQPLHSDTSPRMMPPRPPAAYQRLPPQQSKSRMDNFATNRSAQPHFNPFQQVGQFNPHTQTHTPVQHASWVSPASQQIHAPSSHHSSQYTDRRMSSAARPMHQHSHVQVHHPQSFRGLPSNQTLSQFSHVPPYADIPQSSHAFSSQKEPQSQNIQYFLQGSRSAAANESSQSSSVPSFSSASLWMENAWSPFASYNGNAQNPKDHNPQRSVFGEEC